MFLVEKLIILTSGTCSLHTLTAGFKYSIKLAANVILLKNKVIFYSEKFFNCSSILLSSNNERRPVPSIPHASTLGENNRSRCACHCLPRMFWPGEPGSPCCTGAVWKPRLGALKRPLLKKTSQLCQKGSLHCDKEAELRQQPATPFHGT